MAFPSNKEVRYLTAISLYPSGGTIFEDELRSFCIAFPAGGKNFSLFYFRCLGSLKRSLKGLSHEMDLGSLKRSLKLLSHEMDLVFDDMFA
jgi:hypothetical protein